MMAKHNSTALPMHAHENAADALSRKAAQLFAMLATVYGAGFESFMEMNDRIKGNFLWSCADLAQEIEVLSEHVVARHVDGGV